MKKFLILILAIVLTISCTKDYKCVLKYQVNYPDTTWTHVYTFDGTSDASYRLYRNSLGVQVLLIHTHRPYITEIEIAAVPDETCSIDVTDFKIYKYDIDVEKQEFSLLYHEKE